MLRLPSPQLVATLVVLALSAARLPAQSTLSLDLGLWQMTPQGSLSVGAGSHPGTELDLHDDLGYDESEDVWQGSADIGTTHQLALSYLAFDASARATMAREVQMGASTYAAGTTVDSTLQAEFAGVGYRYAGGGDGWTSGFLMEILWASLETKMTPIAGKREDGDLAAPVPVIGVFAEWQPATILELGGSAQIGAWDWQETSITYLDAQASVRVLLYPFVAGIGYRHLALQGDDTSLPLEVDLTFSGPVFFAGVSF